MVVLIQSRTLEVHLKQTFETCQSNENGLSICRLKSEYKYSEKNAIKMHVLLDDASKTRSIKYSNVETFLLFTPRYQNFWLRAWIKH